MDERFYALDHVCFTAGKVYFIFSTYRVNGLTLFFLFFFKVLLLTGIGQIRYLNRALMRFDSKVLNLPCLSYYFNISDLILLGRNSHSVCLFYYIGDHRLRCPLWRFPESKVPSGRYLFVWVRGDIHRCFHHCMATERRAT